MKQELLATQLIPKEGLDFLREFNKIANTLIWTIMRDHYRAELILDNITILVEVFYEIIDKNGIYFENNCIKYVVEDDCINYVINVDISKDAERVSEIEISTEDLLIGSNSTYYCRILKEIHEKARTQAYKDSILQFITENLQRFDNDLF